MRDETAAEAPLAGIRRRTDEVRAGVDELRGELADEGARGGTADHGEHTDEILAELVCSDDEVLDLRVAGAVW